MNLALQVAPRPPVGEDSAAFTGALTIQGAPIDAGVDFLVAQKGRVVAILLSVDSTGGIDDEQREMLVQSMLDRAQTQLATVHSS